MGPGRMQNTQNSAVKLFVLVAFMVSGCMAQHPVAPDLPHRIIPVADGLKITDSGGQEISFGRAQLGVEVAINRLVGEGLIDGGLTPQGCVLRSWKNGLKLVFEQGHFTGWITGPPIWKMPTTSAGNTCGA